MFNLMMISFLIGGVLGLRFKVFILVPVIGSALVVAVVDGIVIEEGVWRLVSTMVVVAASLQLGYLGGSILRFVTCAMRPADQNSAPVLTSTEGSPSGHLRNCGG